MRVQLAAMAVIACAWVDAQEIDQDLRLNILPTGEKTLEWQGYSARSYFIQSSSDLKNWTWAPNIEEGMDAPMSYEVGGTGDKGFFRLQYTDQTATDPDTEDFDGDGLSNSEEITMHARPRYLISGLSPLIQTDPLDSDTDHDSLSDAWEITNGTDPTDDGSTDVNNGPSGDVDGDGISNYDASVADEASNTDNPIILNDKRIHFPRYAFFDLGEAPDSDGKNGSLVINDRGTVLTKGLFYWKCGTWSSLNRTGLYTYGTNQGIDINDNDLILGQAGELKTDPDSGEDYGGNNRGYLWQDTEAEPEKIADGRFDNLRENTENFSGCVLANNGSAHGRFLPESGSDDGYYLWDLYTGTKKTADNGVSRIDRSGRYTWGSNDNILKIDGNEITTITTAIGKAADILYTNPVNQEEITTPAYIDKDGNFRHLLGGNPESSAISKVAGFSYEGAILFNNDTLGPGIVLKSKTKEAKELIPDMGTEWTQHTSFLMSSTHGWGLLRKSTGTGDSETSKVASILPITLKGKYQKTDGTTIDEDCGVDDFSLTADNALTAVQNRIWVMVPAGTQGMQIKCHSPLASTAQMKISASDITANSANSLDSVLNLTTSIKETQDITPDIQLNKGAAVGATATNHPIGIKVMKERKLKVNLYRISLKRKLVYTSNGYRVEFDDIIKPDIGDPDSSDPGKSSISATDIKNYLDDIYKPQLNVTIELNELSETVMNWEDVKDSKLNIGSVDRFTKEQNAIIETTEAAQRDCDINLFLISAHGIRPYSSKSLTVVDGNPRPTVAGYSNLIRNNNKGYCWVSSHSLGYYNTKQQVLNVIAHEMGHRIIGAGHPDQGTGPAPLPNSNHDLRLMRNGNADASNPGKLMVKQEWDAAEKWLPEVDK